MLCIQSPSITSAQVVDLTGQWANVCVDLDGKPNLTYATFVKSFFS